VSLGPFTSPLLVVVGAGGVGKTTLAAALGLASAADGARTLVMTFDPSLRLKDALGAGEEAVERAVEVRANTAARLDVALLDARSTFDRLIRRYAPAPAVAERIFKNRFYANLAGNLAGILEYMAVERLFEVASERSYDRIILDTPPTRQALDFLQAPDRIVNFLDSGAVKLALKPWWDEGGGLGGLGLRIAARGAEEIADRVLGKRLLRDVVEFFRAFAPLYDGFRDRATEVRKLLRDKDTLFALVAGPGPDRIPDAMFFARKLAESGHRLGPVVVNQVHPEPRRAPAPGAPNPGDGLALLAYLGQRDARGVAELTQLLAGKHPLVAVPLEPSPPSTLPALKRLGQRVASAG
jgi:anion-transporting  ArsA/GET3 family ATPase